MKEEYIGLFTTPMPGSWRVSFPDLPGCEASGKSFQDAFYAARQLLTDRLKQSDQPAPRPRSTVELLIDAQRDSRLRQQLVNAAMHPISPDGAEKELAPLDLVAWQARGGDGSNPKVGT